MNWKSFALPLGLLSLALSFLAGRWSAPTPSSQTIEGVIADSRGRVETQRLSDTAEALADKATLLDELRQANARENDLRSALLSLEAKLAEQEKRLSSPEAVPPSSTSAEPVKKAEARPQDLFVIAGSRFRVQPGNATLTLHHIESKGAEITWEGKRRFWPVQQTIALNARDCSLGLLSVQDGIARVRLSCPVANARLVLLDEDGASIGTSQAQ